MLQQDAIRGDALARRHRHCTFALVHFRLLVNLVNEDVPTLRRADAILETDRLVGRVLEELRAAETTVLDALAGTSRRRAAARLLAGRYERLQRAGLQVGAAVRAGNVPMMRRTMTRFDALTRAACTVQLDVYGSARERARPDAARTGPAPGPSGIEGRSRPVR